MTNSKIKLFHKFTFLLCIITAIYVITTISSTRDPSHYSGGEMKISGILQRMDIDGDQIEMVIKAKESVLVHYYAKDREERDRIDTDYHLGDTIEVIGEMKIPNSNTNFSLFNYRNYLKSKKIYRTFTAEKIDKKKNTVSVLFQMKNKLKERIDTFSQIGPYLRTFLLGDKGELSQEAVESYQDNGVSHLFALSGMHVSFLSGFLLTLYRKIGHHENRFMIFIILFLLFYCFLADFSPSLLRAFFLFVGCFIKKIFHLSIRTEELLVWIFCLLLFYCPYYIYHLGFVFSFTISFFLIRFRKIISKNKIGGLLSISVISFLAGLPIVIQNFFTVNFLGPLWNLFFVPFVTFLVFPLCLITFFFSFLEPVSFFFLQILEQVSLFFRQFSLSLTFAKAPLFLFFLYEWALYFFFWQWEKGKRGWLFFIIFLFVTHYFSPYFLPYSSVTVLDIGQGDCVLIRLSHNRGTVLVDTGGKLNFPKEKWQEKKKQYSLSKSTIIPYLRSVGILKLDYLVLSHGDADHVGEALGLLREFPVDHILMNEGKNNTEEEKILSFAKQNHILIEQISQKTISIGGVPFSFLNRKNPENENEDSLVLYTKINRQNIVLMGDAGESTERYLLDAYNLPKMDILKVGHHGSKNSSSFSFLSTVRPRVALISAGRANRFGHPHSETTDRLSTLHIPYFVTSGEGSIEILLTDTLPIRTCNSGVR